jgi:hypothetical protein
MGWLVFADADQQLVQLVDRQGVPLTVHKEADGTVWMTSPDGTRSDPRPVRPDDPFELDVDPEGQPVVIVDGSGRRP